MYEYNNVSDYVVHGYVYSIRVIFLINLHIIREHKYVCKCIYPRERTSVQYNA